MKELIYNVTVKVENDVHDEWLTWMKEIHIAEVLKTGCFTEAKLSRLKSHQDEDGKTYAIQYHCPSNGMMRHYQSRYAEGLREDHRVKFEGKYIAFRTMLEVIESYQSANKLSSDAS